MRRLTPLASALALLALLAAPAQADIPEGFVDQVNQRFTQLRVGLSNQQNALIALEQRVNLLEQEDMQKSTQIDELLQRVSALEAALANTCPADEAPVCCPSGLEFCLSGGCVDFASDPQHCGGCGNDCGSGAACVSGTCVQTCTNAPDCGLLGDGCDGGLCTCGGSAPCSGATVCNGGACSLCGNGVLDPGEECDDGNLIDNDFCNNQCEINVCAPQTTFGLGVFVGTTCASRCQSEGLTCIGMGTDSAGSNGLYNSCGGATSGTATQTAPGTCSTVLGGNGCSEFTNCLCAPLDEEFTTFGLGVFVGTTCAQRCASEGGTCVGLGTNDTGTNGLYNSCAGATSGTATTTAPGTCSTVMGGNGCSEFATCRCRAPSAECTDTVFGLGVFVGTTCAQRCTAEGGVCVGLGTDADGLNGQFNSCGGATSGTATTTAPGTCTTTLGGNGCSEFANCRCYFGL